MALLSRVGLNLSESDGIRIVHSADFCLHPFHLRTQSPQSFLQSLISSIDEMYIIDRILSLPDQCSQYDSKSGADVMRS